MRILTLSAFFSGHGGGIEVVAGHLARALAQRGHEVVWGAADLDPPPVLDGVRAVPLHSFDPIEKVAGLPMPLLAPAAWAALDREVAAADAVVIHDALYMPSLLAAASARRHRKPWLLMQHIGAIPYTSRLLQLAMRTATAAVTRPMLRRAPQLVFISDKVRAEFADVARERPANLIFNGVDTTLFHPAAPGERNRLRAKLDAANFDELLLFVGRFVERKGLAVLEALARSRPRSLFLMVGAGVIAPETWGLPNVRILGKCDQLQIADLYRAADALLLPSVGEGYPLVLQEAMASGLPVLCGRESTAADPGAAAYLSGVDVDLTDPTGTAARFDVAINAATLGFRPDAAAYARDVYNWSTDATRIEELLRELNGST